MGPFKSASFTQFLFVNIKLQNVHSTVFLPELKHALGSCSLDSLAPLALNDEAIYICESLAAQKTNMALALSAVPYPSCYCVHSPIVGKGQGGLGIEQSSLNILIFSINMRVILMSKRQRKLFSSIQ